MIAQIKNPEDTAHLAETLRMAGVYQSNERLP
jgi:hypothetical protein